MEIAQQHVFKHVFKNLLRLNLWSCSREENSAQTRSKLLWIRIEHERWSTFPKDGILFITSGSTNTYMIKRGTDESVQRYKTRLVFKGGSQKRAVDYEELYSPLVRYAIIRYKGVIGKVWPWCRTDERDHCLFAERTWRLGTLYGATRRVSANEWEGMQVL